MAITSGSKKRIGVYLQSTHFRYALTYVIITFVVLLVLNIYSAKSNQRIYYNSKEKSMLEKTLLASSEIADQEVFNPSTVASVISKMDILPISQTDREKGNQIIVTDHTGTCVYDSLNQHTGEAVSIDVISQALEMNDVFTWTYRDGSMKSQAATPIVSCGSLIGCVYLVDYDDEQGALIQSQQTNTLTITIILEIAVILFALTFSNAFNQRLQKIMASMRIIRGGDYTHKVQMGGNDELTHLGNEFNDLVERLNTSERKRQNFVSDASHELKTPLASIKLLSDSILQNDMDIETVREFVSDIGSEADRLNRMSQKLLTLSRIESQADSDCEIVYIGPAVERAVRMLSATAQGNQVAVNMDLSGDCPILVLEDDLYQIVFNLIENGIKYNKSGGSLTIRIRREEDNALLTVADTGVGIPEDSLAHIFERFYRVDKARSRKSGGAGLGLSIVRNLVERNGGSIRATSTVGEGTTFEVTFPVFDTEVLNETDQLEC